MTKHEFDQAANDILVEMFQGYLDRLMQVQVGNAEPISDQELREIAHGAVVKILARVPDVEQMSPLELIGRALESAIQFVLVTGPQGKGPSAEQRGRASRN